MKKILDWNKYMEKSAETVSEGIVMLENKNHALPLSADEEVAVFGRIQLHYYKSGTGSGGLVNVSKVIGINDGLVERGVKINKELLEVYTKWDKQNPFDKGKGWGQEPWSQKEMPVEDRNQIIDVATEYLNRHGDELPLLEAYILLVIPAYQGSILILIYYS